MPKGDYTNKLENFEGRTIMSKKAIMVVSFGTSVEETRKKTIDAIEEDVRKAFPDMSVYSAWTSRIIAKKTGHPLVEDTAKKMLEDGVTDLVVMPTHIMKAEEYDTITADIKSYEGKFNSLKMGQPLVFTDEDIDWMARFLNTTYRKDAGIKENEILLFMGHGTNHEENRVYTDISRKLALNDFKCTDIFIGTVEGKPDFDDILETVEGKVPEDTTFILAPLMIVAGVHANEDLWSDKEDSWKSVLSSKGYKVRPHLKGLGEYAEVRKRFIEEIKKYV